jgi:hypothetical protein
LEETAALHAKEEAKGKFFLEKRSNISICYANQGSIEICILENIFHDFSRVGFRPQK